MRLFCDWENFCLFYQDYQVKYYHRVQYFYIHKVSDSSPTF